MAALQAQQEQAAQMALTMEAMTQAMGRLDEGIQALQVAPAAQAPAVAAVAAVAPAYERRDNLRALLNQTAQPDGTDPKVTRRWLEDVNMSPADRQMEVAMKSARGTLR